VPTPITTSDPERHIRRMRHEYTCRRAVLAAVFRDGKAGHLLGREAGKHVMLANPPGRRRSRRCRQPAERGGRHANARSSADPVTSNGLVIGYGGAPLAKVARAPA
jgi:DNA-binding transcriptional MocR family regulator